MAAIFNLADIPLNPAPMKALVCDDDIACLRIIQKKLESENLIVFTAKDGEEGLRKLKEFDFDIVITDIHMPFHSGDELVSFIREKQKKATPIIMLSADGEEEIIALAFQQGVDAFIKKPVKPDDLIRTVRKVAKK
ncbi:response regulator [Pseudochryseolinea flava]|uniref:Response regulator n=2 Tax=Pseudochryseolinea flava TaxID=2059302 RepID=A0A364XVV2_9BACT|nr:response regulator [Pseudochryseolinea flava]